MNRNKLNILQLNIEGDKHLDRIIPFLKESKPDVVCMQEVHEPDLHKIAKTMGADYFFTPMNRRLVNNLVTIGGIAIFSRLPIQASSAIQYAGSNEIVDFDLSNHESARQTQRYSVAVCHVIKDDVVIKIATTHFTWTPDGEPDHFQREDMRELVKVLGSLGEFVLCGDFNAPRGGEMFSILSSRYTDNVPTHYVTSLDRKLHRAGHLDRMVDGIFSTPSHLVSEVRMIDGLSDHCALLGEVSTLGESIAHH